jgi:hypothetical protein
MRARSETGAGPTPGDSGLRAAPEEKRVTGPVRIFDNAAERVEV